MNCGLELNMFQLLAFESPTCYLCLKSFFLVSKIAFSRELRAASAYSLRTKDYSGGMMGAV